MNRPTLPDLRPEGVRWWRFAWRNGMLLTLLVFGTFFGFYRADLPALWHVLSDMPLAIAISTAVHLPQVLMAALAWRVLVPASQRPSAGVMSLLRWFRESAGTVLPVGAIVGQVAAARLLARQGMKWDLAGATATVDLTVEAVAQVLFTLFGLGLLILGGHADGITGIAAAGVALAATYAVALVFVQQLQRHAWLKGSLRGLARRWPRLRLRWLADLHRAVLSLHADRRSLTTALCCHSTAWMLGAVEIMGVLDLLGWPIALTDALVTESMAQAPRNAGLVPKAGQSDEKH